MSNEVHVETPVDEATEFRSIPGKRQVGTILQHHRLGHRSPEALLLCHKYELWNDVCLKPEPETICETCKITLIRKSNRNKKTPAGLPTKPGRMASGDIIRNPFPIGLNDESHFQYYFLIVDIASGLPVLLGLNTISSAEVLRLLKVYKTLFRPNIDEDTATEFDLFPMIHFRADAGSQFASAEFRAECLEQGINVTLAAPKHQEMNGICERTWQSLRNLAFAFMNHARVCDEFGDMAFEHSWKVFSVLPIKGLLKDGRVTTPFEKFYGHKPDVRKYRVLFCACYYKVYERQSTNKKSGKVKRFNSKNHPQRGAKGTYIGNARGIQGHLILEADGRTIRVSADVLFDEDFSKTTSPEHYSFRDSRPTYTVESWHNDNTEFTSTVPHDDSFGVPQNKYFEERPSTSDGHNCFTQPIPGYELFTPDDTSQDILYDSSSEEECPELLPRPTSDTDPILEEPVPAGDEFLYKDPLTTPTLRRSERRHQQRRIFDPSDVSPNIIRNNPTNISNCVDHMLSHVTFQNDSADEIFTNAVEALTYPVGEDPTAFQPEPVTLKQIDSLPPQIRDAWLAAHKVELKTLFNMGTFEQPTDYNGEHCLPVKAIQRTKLSSDGTVEKLKVRIAIRGDLDKGAKDEDNSAPLASFRLLKVFIADAARRKRRIFQTDFVGAYLQAYMDRRIFVRLPSEWAAHFPEYAEWFGIPLLLKKSAYGISSAGRLWAEELFGWYAEYGFKQSIVDPALFHYKLGDEWIVLLCYCDDSAYYCSSEATRFLFEDVMCKRFACKLLGQLHWFLQARITQHANFDVTLDQSRYAASVCLRFLTGCEIEKPTKDDKQRYAAPLPTDFIFSKADCSKDYLAVKKLQDTFGFEYPAVIGCMLWLLHTFPRFQFPVRKLARFMRLPGHKHYMALYHLLHHLRCHHLSGLTFYSDCLNAPVSQMLFSEGVDPSSPLIAFSDSSWQDCVDDGKSTGCCLVLMQGGVIDAISCVPDPVALSSCEAEYNMACVAATCTNACAMLVQELRGNDPDLPMAVPILLDSMSAIGMGESFRDTKRTRHVLRRYHYTRWMVDSGRIILIWVPGDLQLADAGTKNLNASAPTWIIFLAMVETPVTL